MINKTRYYHVLLRSFSTKSNSLPVITRSSEFYQFGLSNDFSNKDFQKTEIVDKIADAKCEHITDVIKEINEGIDSSLYEELSIKLMNKLYNNINIYILNDIIYSILTICNMNIYPSNILLTTFYIRLNDDKNIYKLNDFLYTLSNINIYDNHISLYIIKNILSNYIINNINMSSNELVNLIYYSLKLDIINKDILYKYINDLYIVDINNSYNIYKLFYIYNELNIHDINIYKLLISNNLSANNIIKCLNIYIKNNNIPHLDKIFDILYKNEENILPNDIMNFFIKLNEYNISIPEKFKSIIHRYIKIKNEYISNDINNELILKCTLHDSELECIIKNIKKNISYMKPETFSDIMYKLGLINKKYPNLYDDYIVDCRINTWPISYIGLLSISMLLHEIKDNYIWSLLEEKIKNININELSDINKCYIFESFFGSLLIDLYISNDDNIYNKILLFCKDAWINKEKKRVNILINNSMLPWKGIVKNIQKNKYFTSQIDYYPKLIDKNDIYKYGIYYYPIRINNTCIIPIPNNIINNNDIIRNDILFQKKLLKKIYKNCVLVRDSDNMNIIKENKKYDDEIISPFIDNLCENVKKLENIQNIKLENIKNNDSIRLPRYEKRESRYEKRQPIYEKRENGQEDEKRHFRYEKRGNGQEDEKRHFRYEKRQPRYEKRENVQENEKRENGQEEEKRQSRYEKRQPRYEKRQSRYEKRENVQEDEKRQSRYEKRENVQENEKRENGQEEEKRESRYEERENGQENEKRDNVQEDEKRESRYEERENVQENEKRENGQEEEKRESRYEERENVQEDEKRENVQEDEERKKRMYITNN
eukprot:GHVL01037257.1.p1 GENE.GHVL01037257.1~~GHVL01037257.1.p1  ORF type:complete len:828 (+),score=326.67 GHVL01037257.1:35-2518(+)